MKIKRPKRGPEWYIQRNIKAMLEARGWHVERLIGNAFQTGIPDLYCFHKKYGERWIDAKQPKHYNFTKAQRYKWPLWTAAGIGIWILVGATQEEYDKLFQRPNWQTYIKKSWKMPTQAEIDKLMDEMENW